MNRYRRKVHYFYPRHHNRILRGFEIERPEDTVEPELVTCLLCKYHLGLHHPRPTPPNPPLATHIIRKQTTWHKE